MHPPPALRAGLGLFLTLALFLYSRPGGAGSADLLTQVDHEPQAPKPGESVEVRVTAAEQVGAVTLEYQVVDPGRYIELGSPEYSAGWIAREMVRMPEAQGSREFRVALEPGLHLHRRLVRYRFQVRDGLGRRHQVPSAEDPRRNYAYFVYGGVPGWTAAIQPRGGVARWRQKMSYGPEVMRRVQSYHVLATRRAVENVTWNDQSHDDVYRYTGTLVVDGVVYDHTRLRARGGVWRYAMGKNMWKFAPPPGQAVQVRDDYGRPYPLPWGKINLRACIQQGDYGYRGEQGMFESVGFRMFELAGIAAPRTHWVQLRFITDREEAPADQYRGDYWGLYLAFEDVNGDFLKAHELPEGSIFKMENGGGELEHAAPGAPEDGSDLRDFLVGYHRGNRPDAWWRETLDLPWYYSYRAICECLHHYDIGDGKNYFYYLNSKSRRWQVLPWDIDLTWADTMYGSGEEPFYRRVLSRPVFRLEYQNRLREIRDLLYHPAESGSLIDEVASIVADPRGGPSPVDADRAKWDFHPVMAMGGKAGQGLFYQAAPTGDFAGMVQLMKDYVARRGAWIDRALLRDSEIPAKPAVAYRGPAGFPRDQLVFEVPAYRGAAAFAGMEWRLAEIAPPMLRGGRATQPGLYEITPRWNSGVLERFQAEGRIPAESVEPGRTYRVRVRMKDATGRWSHWSDPVQFVAGAGKE